MAQAVKSIKAYVRSNNTATIICPSCGVPKIINTTQLKQMRPKVKMKCRCNNIFNVEFDYRRHYRKITSLPGTYVILKNGQGGGIMNIQDISKSGVGFSVSGLHNLHKDQLIEIEFILNDRNKNKIKKQAIVKSVNKNKIGCQFDDVDETGTSLGKALGFYLQGVD